MAEDIAMQNFMMNTLRGGGGGEGGGLMSHSNGYAVAVPGFLNKQTNLSFEQQQKVFTSPDMFSYTLGKMFDGVQAYASSFSVSTMTSGQNFSPGTLVSIVKGGKIQSVVSSRGAGG